MFAGARGCLTDPPNFDAPTPPISRAAPERAIRGSSRRSPSCRARISPVPRPGSSAPAGGSIGTRDGDLSRLYGDVLIAIDKRRGINNGQPSLHALCIDALSVREGETVLHIGAGAGYYTAILAHLVGPAGRVAAYEIEPDIAERARANLAGAPQVEVRASSGADDGLPSADCIYVNCAASHPVRAWLDALKVGGRLLFPLQAEHSTGAMLLVTRPEQGDAWPARFLTGVVFIACVGAQNAEMGRRLDEAYARGGSERVRSLRFGRRAEPIRLASRRRLGAIDGAGRVAGEADAEQETKVRGRLLASVEPRP